MTDPIADLLTRIRNASQVGLREVVLPFSRFKLALAELLAREGFLAHVETIGEKRKSLRLTLRYLGTGNLPAVAGLKRISTPGQRIYASFSEIPRVRNGFGSTIVSTSKGLLTDREARRQKIGGEVVCQVW